MSLLNHKLLWIRHSSPWALSRKNITLYTLCQKGPILAGTHNSLYYIIADTEDMARVKFVARCSLAQSMAKVVKHGVKFGIFMI